ncbi:MAG: TraR/DksA C4-type zinc finger protein [Tepidisphaeraceae bacterium]
MAKQALKKAPPKKMIVKPAARQPAPATKATPQRSTQRVALKAAAKATARPLVATKSPVARPAPAKAAPNRSAATKAAPARQAAKMKPATMVSRPSIAATMRATRRPAPEPIVNRPPPTAPVPTNGKPRKNQAGLTARELEHFRDLLFQKRRELVGDMGQMEREALRSAGGSNLSNLPLHMADMGTDNYEQEFTLGLVEKERNLLREINTALAKIMDGSYGTCEGTGKPISQVRLEAQPWAKYSIDYARQMEKGFIR